MLKRFLSVFVVIVILFSLSANCFTGYASTANLDPNAVYFVNIYYWDDVYCYCWEVSDDGKPVDVPNNYPGIKMILCGQYEGYDLYMASIEVGSYNMIEFNDGSGNGNTQTYTAHSDDYGLVLGNVY